MKFLKATSITTLMESLNKTDSVDYCWHRDREDRIIESIVDTDWMIQLDDELQKLFKVKFLYQWEFITEL